VPPNRLSVWLRFNFPTDPVEELRKAISGRTVERIRIDPPSACSFPDCPREPAYAYVDPETFYPVKGEGMAVIVPAPRRVLRLHMVMRYLTFEYLPRTTANLALTDIHAQHPNATGP
jgi:hypothetical protein